MKKIGIKIKKYRIFSHFTANCNLGNKKQLSWPGFRPHTRLLEGSLLSIALPTTTSLAHNFFAAGLTSKLHRAHSKILLLTWIVSPATGIDLQPQTWVVLSIIMGKKFFCKSIALHTFIFCQKVLYYLYSILNGKRKYALWLLYLNAWTLRMLAWRRISASSI